VPTLKAVADGIAQHYLHRNLRRHLARRRPAGHRGHRHHWHPDRLHHPENSLFRPVTGLLSTGVSVISSLAPFADLRNRRHRPPRPAAGRPGRDRRRGQQETYLLHITVRENLRYAKPGATDARSRTPPARRRSMT
jgi:hypothetical protein